MGDRYQSLHSIILTNPHTEAKHCLAADMPAR